MLMHILTPLTLVATMGFLPNRHEADLPTREVVFVALPQDRVLVDCVCKNQEPTACTGQNQRNLTIQGPNNTLIVVATISISNMEIKNGECEVEDVCKSPKPCKTSFDATLTIHDDSDPARAVMGGNGLYLVSKSPSDNKFASKGNPATLSTSSEVNCGKDDCPADGGGTPAGVQAHQPGADGPSGTTIASLHVTVPTFCKNCKSAGGE